MNIQINSGMQLVIFIVTLLWLIRIFRNILSYVHLWWVKEYRFDRMLIHLKTDQGRNILLIPFRRPPVSPKTIVLFIAMFLTLTGLFFLIHLSVFVKLFILDLIAFPLTWIWVGILKLPTYIYHELFIALAINKLRSHSFKHVIGITGSYGKTSTKEFLATILESKFKVLKTETSKNSPIAIAELVMKKLQPEHEVFVVEMAAYKRGEIRRMTEMVRPDIGIVTAINAQHQDLFGTLENTLKAKYELIQGLSGERAAIFNLDNEYTRKMADWANQAGCRVLFYTKEKSNTADDIMSAQDILFYPDHLTFKVRRNSEIQTVSVRVLGEHQVSNILAAMIAVISSGMTFADAAKGVEKIHPFTKIMESVPGIKGAMFINDTFNNNPAAVTAAIAYLSHMKGRKILVFQPMIELGEFANSAHETVGKYAARVCDDLIVTNKNYFAAISTGVKSVGSKMKLQVVSPQIAADYIKATIKKADTVLFKGKEAENTLKILLKKDPPS